MFRFRAFDVDMLHVAQYYKMPIGEVAVSWTEIDGMWIKKGLLKLNVFSTVIYLRNLFN